MQAIEELPQSGTEAYQHPALRKLQRLTHLMRLLSAGYAAWVLWNILSWRLDTERMLKGYGNYLERDLHAAAIWQQFASLALDLGTWALLLMAVVQCWMFLRHVSPPLTSFNRAAHHLSRCAWFATACQAISLLVRPLQSYLLTFHLAAGEQVWKWMFRPQDLLSILFCLALLMFAYIFTWTLELAEENRSFV
jgi:hypothetical protein